MKDNKLTLSEHMSRIAKLSHEKNPRSKEFFSEMGKKSAEARRKKKELEI